MSNMNQILSHLKAGNYITQAGAIDLFQCYRLSARIYDLREKGYKIESIWMQSPNKKRYVAYQLRPE